MKVKTKIDHVGGYGVKAGAVIEVEDKAGENLVKAGYVEKAPANAKVTN